MVDIFPVLGYFKNDEKLDKDQMEKELFDEANLERLSKLKVRDRGKQAKER